MLTVNDIRKAFLDYFHANAHEIVASSPLVPHNDPTLLFTNAGMVQFKNVFTGAESRAIPRAVTSQKCVRAGGKHNDLENVGHTARHHTFFEMLGNFSFGDYFKENAIELAWNLITKEFGLPKDKLLVTIYHDDDEAAKYWKSIAGLADDRIIRIATSDNFWSMGDVGPCGPCSEIFYDHGDHIPGGPPGSPDEDGDRFIEIWNLVFMQYEQKSLDERVSLPSPSIDTGMGIERIAAIMQGKHDNYDIDLMQHLIASSAHHANVDIDGDHKVSHRVIADHLRSSCFLIADGVLPSNEGRGYVLRRIMRRAMRHAHQMGCREPLMHKLVPALIETMGGHYTELGRAEALMTEILKLEESRFKETLDRGLKILMEEVDKNPGSQTLDGQVAFKLYDTYGFPIDLTQDVLRGEGWTVDQSGFDTAMEKQKAAARKAWSGTGDKGMSPVYLQVAEKAGATEFLGYNTTTANGMVVALIKDEAETMALNVGEKALLVTNQTPFYAESGGQIGDTGIILDEISGDKLAQVTDVWKTPSGVFFHVITAFNRIDLNQSCKLIVDHERRQYLKCNHSATHLLQEALREVLGTHVMQKGSLVSPDRLRFDFSHTKQVDSNELASIEAIVNHRLLLNSDVTTRLMTQDDAIAEGALALFGEKYGDEVRVVSMGGATTVDGRAAWSVELCGGTHVSQTGEIGLFKIISESAVAGGVRRIEAVTNDGAMRWINDRLTILNASSQLLKTTPEQLSSRLDILLQERRQAEQMIADLRRKLAEGGGDASGAMQRDIGDFKLTGRILTDTPAKDLKSIADTMMKQARGAVILVSSMDGKASLVVAISPDATDQLNAVDLVRIGAEQLGGKGGGGRPEMAQAGGSKPDKAEDAINAIMDAIEEILK
ncbi:MAG: alanine--tRNA ligase [Alphaproteobacteria bacterium]|nr:alanine--tRNA ligase [Alphaproteobacteria bacterium]